MFFLETTIDANYIITTFMSCTYICPPLTHRADTAACFGWAILIEIHPKVTHTHIVSYGGRTQT